MPLPARHHILRCFFTFILGGGEGGMVWALHLFIINILFERACFYLFFLMTSVYGFVH